MIARLWQGAVRREDGDAYAEYIDRTGIEEYGDAIRAFAGDDIDAAVYYPEDDRYLIERGPRVDHYEIVASL